jgi:hypothetical protein
MMETATAGFRPGWQRARRHIDAIAGGDPHDGGAEDEYRHAEDDGTADVEERPQ